LFETDRSISPVFIGRERTCLGSPATKKARALAAYELFATDRKVARD